MYFSTWKSVMLRRQNTAAMSARPSAHGYIPRRLCEIYSACDINPIAARQKSPSPPSQNSTMPPHGKCQSGLSALCFSSATQTFAETWFRPRPPARCGNGFCSYCFYPMRETSAAPDSSHAPPARYKSGFCSHCFYPMRANLRRPRFQSRPTGEVRRGAIGLP